MYGFPSSQPVPPDGSYPYVPPPQYHSPVQEVTAPPPPYTSAVPPGNVYSTPESFAAFGYAQAPKSPEVTQPQPSVPRPPVSSPQATNSVSPSQPAEKKDDGSRWLLFFILWSGIVIGMIVVGRIHIDNCAIQPSLPQWMWISGAVWAGVQCIFLLALFMHATEANNLEDSARPSTKWFNFWWLLSVCAFTAIGISGAVQISRVNKSYCNSHLYNYALSCVILHLVVVGFFFFCSDERKRTPAQRSERS